MEKRLDWVDSARGLAMILVILSHCLTIVTSTFPYLNKLILSFHMPLFFFISGLFAKPIRGSVGNFFSTKAKHFLLPQLLLCFLRLIEDILFVTLKKGNVSEIQWINWDWFLPVLFMCSVLYSFILTLIKQRGAYIKLLLVFLALLLIFPAQTLNKHEFLLAGSLINSRHIAVLPMAFLFYILGNIFFNYKDKIFFWYNSIKPEIMGLIMLIMLSLLGVLSFINDSVYMYKNEYGNYFTFLSTSIMGILLTIFYFSDYSSAFLSYVGKNSIYYYVWNFITIHFVTSIMFKVWGDIVKESIVL